jgi:hypothetical protein
MNVCVIRSNATLIFSLENVIFDCVIVIRFHASRVVGFGIRHDATILFKT